MLGRKSAFSRPVAAQTKRFTPKLRAALPPEQETREKEQESTIVNKEHLPHQPPPVSSVDPSAPFAGGTSHPVVRSSLSATLVVPKPPPTRPAPRFAPKTNSVTAPGITSDIHNESVSATSTSLEISSASNKLVTRKAVPRPITKTSNSHAPNKTSNSAIARMSSRRKRSALSAVSILLRQEACSTSGVDAARSSTTTKTQKRKKNLVSNMPSENKKKKKKNISSDISASGGIAHNSSIIAKDSPINDNCISENQGKIVSVSKEHGFGVQEQVFYSKGCDANHNSTTLPTNIASSRRRNRYLEACMGIEPSSLPSSSVEFHDDDASDDDFCGDSTDPSDDFDFDFYTVFLKRNEKGSFGLRLRNLDGYAAVGGFTNEFKEQYLSTDIINEPSRGVNSTMTGANIRIDDIIVAVGNLDALCPRSCPFEKVVKHLAMFNSSRDPRRGLGGVGQAANYGSYSSWDHDSASVQNRTKTTQHSVLQDTICIKFARPRPQSLHICDENDDALYDESECVKFSHPLSSQGGRITRSNNGAMRIDATHQL